MPCMNSAPGTSCFSSREIFPFTEFNHRASFDCTMKGRILSLLKSNSFFFAISIVLLLLSLFSLHNAIRTGNLDPNLFFSSDALYLPAVYRDLVQTGYGLSGWKAPPAPSFVPDMLLMFFSMSVSSMHSVYSAVRIYAIGMILLLIISIKIFYRSVVQTELERANASPGPPENIYNSLFFPSGFSLLIGAIVTGSMLAHRGSFLSAPPLPFFTVGSFHGGVIVLSVLALSVLIRIMHQPNTQLYILYFILVYLGLISDSFFIVYFIFPGHLALLAYARRHLKEFLFINLIAGVAFYCSRLTIRTLSVFGFSIASKDIGRVDSFRSRAPFLDFWNDLSFFFHDPLPQYYILVLLASLVLALYYITKKYKISGKVSNISFLSIFFILFLIIGFPSSFLVSKLLYRHYLQDRYLTIFYILPLIFLPLFFEFQWRGSGRLFLFFSALVAMIPVTSGFWALNAPSWKHPLVQCLDSMPIKSSERYGISDYWNAKPIRLLSEQGFEVNQLGYNLDIQPWVMNIRWYYGEKELPQYSFILPERLNKKAIVEQFGTPAHIKICDKQEVFFYDRFDHKGDMRLRNLFSRPELDLWRKLTGQ